ncbi:MAG: alanine dehydrogenase [Deltaproteobacteria bacterium]|nr:MAG: alanine dehydrogenase [Deltaproteobacteria bacterium]
MVIGLPKELKQDEYRVAITPGGVRQLVEAGHEVLVEVEAGAGSGFGDDKYRWAGARLVPRAEDAWGADLVVKVKEPQPSEYGLMRPGLALFTYLHLAAEKALTLEMLERGVIGIAYETVECDDGTLPLLTPMSEIAGRMAVQVGAQYLEKTHGGRGKLLGGVPGVRPADVTIIGAGVVGTNATQMALGMGANVIILDVNTKRLRYLEQVMHGRLTTLSANPLTIAEGVKRADLLIGGVLVKGAKAPRLVTREMVRTMEAGSVIVDVSVDQGGCVETTRPATHSDPVHMEEGIVHYGVTNMPGAVPRTSTYALSNATLPYLMKLADQGILDAVRKDHALAKGVNIYLGKITYKAVAETFGLEYRPLESMISGEA